MITKNDVILCYRALLDREPESEDVVYEKTQAGRVEEVIADMIVSREFMEAHKMAIVRLISQFNR
jgi:hypothetical protein